MTAATGLAMQMQLQLKTLMRKHGITPKPILVPLSPPPAVDDCAIDITGYASTTDVDLSRQKFRAYAFSNLCLYLKGYALPKLLYRHDESQIAGTIESLSYDDRGSLKIRAEVRHAQAARCNAFSVGARFLEYEIVDADNKNFHALIRSAEITEVSLTDAPCDPRALVQSRHRATAMNAYRKTQAEQTDLMIRGVRLIQRQIEVLQQVIAAPAREAPRAEVRRAPMIISAPRRPRVEAHRATPFGALVSAMERKSSCSWLT